MAEPQRIAAAVARLDEITRRLRRECPWDREQDERSIVPHTVEESYELADAARRGDDAKLIDELGDVLFQVHFLSLLLEERGAGDMETVADHCREKLVRRHPHVFQRQQGGADRSEHIPPPPLLPRGREESDTDSPALPRPGAAVPPLTADEVLQNWDRIKVEVEGRGGEDPFEDVPENLPALLYARKLQRRAASRGLATETASDPLEAGGRSRRAIAELEALAAAGHDGGPGTEADSREAVEAALGEALFALVDAARQLRCDPELALRAAADRFRSGAA